MGDGGGSGGCDDDFSASVEENAVASLESRGSSGLPFPSWEPEALSEVIPGAFDVSLLFTNGFVGTAREWLGGNEILEEAIFLADSSWRYFSSICIILSNAMYAFLSL